MEDTYKELAQWKIDLIKVFQDDVVIMLRIKEKIIKDNPILAWKIDEYIKDVRELIDLEYKSFEELKQIARSLKSEKKSGI